MKSQIAFVEQRDGKPAAIEYASRALTAYRSAARYRNPEKRGQRHFVHIMPFRPHVVRGILEIREYLAGKE
jgi:hypothetical protein